MAKIIIEDPKESTVIKTLKTVPYQPQNFLITMRARGMQDYYGFRNDDTNSFIEDCIKMNVSGDLNLNVLYNENGFIELDSSALYGGSIIRALTMSRSLPISIKIKGSCYEGLNSFDKLTRKNGDLMSWLKSYKVDNFEMSFKGKDPIGNEHDKLDIAKLTFSKRDRRIDVKKLELRIREDILPSDNNLLNSWFGNIKTSDDEKKKRLVLAI